MLACIKVTKKIKGQTILSDITMRIEPGECVCITGSARSGKTTLFRLLIKADEPTSGSIEIDNVPLKTLPPLILQLYRTRLGIIFQEPRLLMHATVAENIAYPLELRGVAPRATERHTTELLKRFHLQAKANLLPSALSLSERALVGIARAIATSPMILIADEPLQMLDEAQAQEVLAVLREAQGQGCTVIVFTGNSSIAEALSARTLTLSNGKITEERKRKEAEQPAVQHRILEAVEETPAASELTLDIDEHPVVVRTPKDRKKVKITSINS